MHLILDVPPGWHLRRQGGASSLSPPGAPSLLTVRVSALYSRAAVDLPSLLRVDSPPLARWQHHQTVDATTVTGWPMEITTATMVDASGVRDTRLAAVYSIVHWVGCAVAVCSNAELYEEQRPLLLRLFASARPYLRTAAPTCIHELYDMS